MGYPTPTTAEEMYEILKQIYYDYRLRIDAYEDAGLEDLVLSRMSYVEKTDEELLEEATILVSPWFDEKYSKARKEVEAQIDACNKRLEEIEEKGQTTKYSLEEEISKGKEEIEREAIKKGYSNSDITLEKIFELMQYKNDKLLEINAETSAKKSKVQEERALLNSRLEGILSEYQEYFENKKQAKFQELKAEQDKEIREVFKYNNGLDEKEKRSKNANISANASLKLRYLEIRTQSYTTEELVDMGYYGDVIDCVCDYYNSITDSLEAYKQFCNDTKVLIYLEDYYDNVLALYRAKAGL